VSPATSSGGSSGQPSDTFSDQVSIGSASTWVAAISLSVCRRNSATRPGMRASVIRSIARIFSASASGRQVPNSTALR